LLRIFLYTFFIPAFAVAMLRPLGFISSLEMEDRTERTGPYIITAIFYLWAYMNMRNSALFPPAYASFMLGAVIALFVAFFINIFSKISAHAVGMGGLLAMVIITMLRFSHDVFTIQTGLLGTINFNMNAVLIIVIVLCGLVGTARLLLKAHEPRDLYGGFMVGFVAQLLALRFSI
jgi:membrane-associated phospholipid phosphatase